MKKHRYMKVFQIISIIIIAILIFQITKLNDSISEINNSYNLLSKEKQKIDINFKELDDDYLNLKNETRSLLFEVDTYKREIEKSLEWYKENSVLNNSNKEKKVKNQIDGNCIRVKQNECRIKLGCFYLINSEKLSLEYKYDELVYGKNDKLSSINDFLENKGGDCEDYSLFFKAEYNYALSQCEDKKVVLEGWKYPNETDRVYRYWLNFQKSWYIDDVAEIRIEDNIYPNIICGNLYDPVLEDISGHCMIAFTKNKITSVDDLQELDDAYIIEPQDGSFKGNVNKPNSEVYLLGEVIDDKLSYNSYISSVITDNDYFLFSEDSSDWKSYNSFDVLLENKKTQISNLLNEG